jgi:hypothetical protein
VVIMQVIRGRLVGKSQAQLPLLQVVRTPETIFNSSQADSVVAKRRTDNFEVFRIV